MPKTSILIADDFPIARGGLCKLLENQSDWKVVGEAADGFDALDKAAVLIPDIVILDDVIDGFVFRFDPEAKPLTALRKVLSGERFPTSTKLNIECLTGN